MLWPPASNHAEQDLRRWGHGSAHDSAEACQKTRLDTLKLLLPAAADSNDENLQRTFNAAMASRCIASDDPRLIVGAK